SSDLLLRNSSPHRGKNSRHSHLCRRAGATPRTFWAAESRKSGVAPARFDFFSTVTFVFAASVFFRPRRTSDLLGVKKCEFQKVQNVILTSSLGIRRIGGRSNAS